MMGLWVEGPAMPTETLGSVSELAIITSGAFMVLQREGA